MGTAETSPPSVEPEETHVRPGESGGDQPVPEHMQSEDPVAPKQRGLWGMMGQPPVVAVPPSASGTSGTAESDRQIVEQDRGPGRSFTESEDTLERAEPRRGLFALMQVANERPAKEIDDLPLLDEIPGQTDEPGNTGPLDDPLDDVSPAVTDSSRPDLALAPIDLEELEPPKYRVAAMNSRKQARASFVCGLAATLASALSLLPNVLAGVPATATGFVAIILGYLAITGPGRRELSRTAQAVSIFGMVLGTAGIFLGPLLFASIGRTFREATGQQVTIQHLTQIGDALDRHYQEHDGYPIGGTFARNDEGVIQGQHGWMTFLLPYVGEASLYQEVDQSKPFDDPVNRNSMGRNVTVYFAAGGDRSRIGQGFAVAHFAGVGGEIDDANRLSHLGIFERDVAIKREEITDGLSNTLIVGELAGTYPPWGDPENWRKIGRGLNRDINGFGNYNGVGAIFLLADGTVKFFNNKTDPGLLERMTTRDGSE